MISGDAVTDSAHAQRLREKAGARFGTSARGEVLVDVGGLRAIVHAEEVLFILHEIFVAGCYEVHFDYPAVVWDVGSNRGLASLYFARKPNVVAVVAYEPFGPTYRQAQQNLALNPALSRKITAHNRGLGGTRRALRTGYCPQWTGNMRVDGVPRWLAEDRSVAVIDEEINILDVETALQEIRAAHPGVPIVAKIDCEGSEYEIVRALHAGGRLDCLKAILMEWHLEGPQALTNALTDVGFTVFPADTRADRGMLYAVR